jgi:hypothetical protein
MVWLNRTEVQLLRIKLIFNLNVVFMLNFFEMSPSSVPRISLRISQRGICSSVILEFSMSSSPECLFCGGCSSGVWSPERTAPAEF